jgi:hypothetical protein
MNFLLRVDNDVECTQTPDVVHVVINKKERELLLRRRKMFQALKDYDVELSSIEFTDQNGWYIVNDEAFLDEVHELHVIRDKLLGAYGYVTEVRVECQFMQLDDSGVYWECRLKHSDIRVVSTVLHWDFIGTC